jgi:predicted translin family RNA/ssDNA-binding protein
VETDIERWLNFAVKVENKLQTINTDSYSENYISGISNLLSELRREAANVSGTSLVDNQERYFKVNQLAQKLRNTAHFAHHA